MSVVAKFAIQAADFAVGELFSSVAEIQADLDRVIPVGRRNEVPPFFWVSTEDFDGFERALEESTDVEEHRALTEVNDERLYQVVWVPETDGFIEAILETEAALLEGTSRGEEWHFELRFPNHEQVAVFDTYCRDRNVPVELLRLQPYVTRNGPTLDLTPTQWETLELAHEQGFFRVPREKTLSELADTLEISPQAVSQRLRRGTGTLVEQIEFPARYARSED